jgi:hypothetical protein
MLSPKLRNYYVKLDFIIDFRKKKKKNSKLTSHFGMIAQIWIELFPRSLQMVSEPHINARSYGTGAPHDMALTRTSRVYGGSL